MFTRKSLHLWLIGGIAFFGFAYAKYVPIQSMSTGVSPVRGAVAKGPAVNDHLSNYDGKAELLYSRRCGACHSLDANRIGPRHRGVFGREAGSLPDYDYSEALRRAMFSWDEASLDQWLANPEAVAPGQKMGFRLGNADERTQIIDYLKAQSR